MSDQPNPKDPPLLAQPSEAPARKSEPPLSKWYVFVLATFCAVSLAAFFLPNGRLTLPIFGKVDVSMYDFVAPRPNQPANSDQKMELPKIDLKDVLSNEDLHLNKANIGVIMCLLSVLGLVLHYFLTVVWVVLALSLRRTFALLNVIWLTLGLQFPILFSIGGHMVVAGVKASLLSNSGADPMAAAMAATLLKDVSMQPGIVMWGLMTFAIVGLAMPILVRRNKD